MILLGSSRLDKQEGIDPAGQDFAVRRQHDLCIRSGIDIATLVAAGEQVNSFLSRSSQASRQALVRPVTARDQHVDTGKQVGNPGHSLDFTPLVPGEDDYGQTGYLPHPAEQLEERPALLEGLAAADGYPFDLSPRRPDG
jgi:hypothetical protein